MGKMTVEDVSRLDFCDLEIAYLFYCWYAKITGFSVRKSHILRNTCRENLCSVWPMFVKLHGLILHDVTPIHVSDIAKGSS